MKTARAAGQSGGSCREVSFPGELLQEIGMDDAFTGSMSRRFPNPWLRFIVWTIILVVPGGMILLGMLAAERLRTKPRSRALEDSARQTKGVDISENPESTTAVGADASPSWT